MRVACIVKRWNHHTASGGYDRMAAAVGAEVIARVGNFGRSGIGKAWARYLTGTGRYMLDYQLGDLLAEARTLSGAILSPPDIVHTLYGDEQLDLLLRYRRLLRCPLVATFHLPYARSAERFEHFQKGLGPRIDAAVVMCRSEIAPLERIIGEGKVVFIPHGIDTRVFSPGNAATSPGERLRLLFVGEHMRDWEVIHRVIDTCNHRALDVDFTIVTHDWCRSYFTGCDTIDFRSNIPETELVAAYRAADAAFIPVTNATANNSALEAIACGTPVISTDVGGVPDYVDPASGWLLPLGDADAVMRLIVELKADRALLAARRAPARAQALTMDWGPVGAQMTAVYRGLLAGIKPADALAAHLSGQRPR